MKSLLHTFVAMTVLLCFPSVSAQSAGCPSDTPIHREMVEKFLTSNEYADALSTYSIPVNSVNSLRRLGVRAIGDQGSISDATACEILNDYYSNHIQSPLNPDPYHQSAYYTASGFYFVVLRLRPALDPNQLRLGLEYIIIYDSNMNRLMGYTI